MFDAKECTDSIGDNLADVLRDLKTDGVPRSERTVGLILARAAVIETLRQLEVPNDGMDKVGYVPYEGWDWESAIKEALRQIEALDE